VSGVRVYADLNNNGTFDFSSYDYTNDIGYGLPDLTTVNAPITVSGETGTVQNLSVRVDLTQTYIGDLDIYLVSPIGTRVMLATDLGGSRNGMNVTFSDSAPSAATSWPTDNGPAINGTYRPEGSLATLNGQSLNGTWKLEITDDEPNDTGTLVSWSIFGSNAEPSSVSAADGSYSIRALSAGSYTIRREAPTAPWIAVTPDDNAYENTSLAAAQLVEASFGQRNGTLPAQLSQSFLFETSAPKLVVTFSENVNVPAGSYSVVNADTNQPVNATASFNTTTQAATITFTDGVLPSGRYRLTTTTSIHDGTNPLVNPSTFEFDWMRGDFTLDGTVDFEDLLIVAQNYEVNGMTYSQGDVNWDGLVNFNDLLFIAQLYGTSLVTSAPSTPARFGDQSIADELLD